MSTILLVENSPIVAELIRDALAKAPQPGFNVVRVAQPNEAVRWLSEGGIDAVLLDLELPDSNGIDTLAQISKVAPETPVVVLTSSDDPSLVTSLLHLGMQNYLIKTEIRPGTLAGMLVCSIEHKRVLTKLQAEYDRLNEYFSAIREGQVDAIIGSDPESTVLHIEAMKLHEENKRVAEVLARSNAKLKELDKAKSEFLSIASHELRTPLTIIKEYVGLLHDGIAGPVTSDQKECLESALQNCNRLANLINDILDLQRLDSGRVRIRRSKIDVAALLGNCHHDFLSRCQTKYQRLELQISENLPPVLCDPGKLTQVLVNLVANAYKFTPEGGAITIRDYVPDTAAQYVTFQIEDTGVGISEEDQECVFDKFTQLDRQPGPGAKGTGLGLAIAKNIVELHGGEISLKSSPGEGSTFTFTIPVYTEDGELTAFIEDRLSAATATGKELSVTLLKLDATDQGDSGYDPGDKIDRLREIEKCVRQTLRRKNDETLVLESEKILVIVAETDKAGAESLRHRVEQSIANEFGATIPVALGGGMVSAEDSPEDWMAKMKGQFLPLRAESLAKRVLIVDDEEQVLELISQALESSSLNLKIELANEGYKACLRFEEFEPHLVILDINMPGYDGEQVLRRIISNPRWGTTKVMVISGTPEKFRKMAELGADDCLAKPFDLKALVDMVASLLHGGTRDTLAAERELIES